MRTKQEVINFLESKVGTKIPCKGNSSLDGQCVTLIKALMEFLGMPDPYKARGHAKTCISAYLNEGIADKGIGFISIFSNKNMGNGYGHVWCNAGEGNGVYYESNGAKPLICTKGKTYKYDNVCNFDRYITDIHVDDIYPSTDRKEEMQTLEFLDCDNFETAERKLIEHLGVEGKKCAWGDASGSNTGGHLGAERRLVKQLEETISQQDKDYLELDEANRKANTLLAQKDKQIQTFENTIIEKNKTIDSLQAQIATLKNQADKIIEVEASKPEDLQEIERLRQELVTLRSQCDVNYVAALEKKYNELKNRSLYDMLNERLREILE